jgi:hypothetical protein
MGATAAIFAGFTGITKIAGERQNAKNEANLAQFQSEQLNVSAGQAQAAAQRSAIDIERQTQLNASRALAVAASSGGGASDPTVVNLLSQNAADGAYRKAAALYEGDDQARSMRLQAAGIDTGSRIAQGQSRARQAAMFVDTAASAYGGYARGTSMKSKYS